MTTRLGAGTTRVYIAQGEQAIGDRPDHVITTILGSCIAVCLWSPDQSLGGMNHILLPESPGRDIAARGAGACSMERLVNALMKCGADRGALRAKVFGGASIVAGLSDIGERNAKFVFEYLETEQIPCLAKSTGGQRARQIRFWPATGQVQQRFVRPDEAPALQTGPVERANGLELL
ncbi:chemotaxis protein CheD [Ovoidimarina sediminis]|uniref:chemotaxis protein CheD n=1 Tax=Ovoidimarina sediminis TaxID=3079856 RepID=UPI0029134272|nr:chemotaxis protein CheD [Rhodophyticola sp. MJ-SS7]MDU8945140.1 chemotaxis protein CheD [Rhodophyticola sp. MJ-SS7]